ncbi:RCC1 repeat- and reductase domain-containing protein, partial [Frankia sp. CNm7]|nr:RCC1 repeat- and reductase domain-containing protein [Frankia nepalensis]MBL7521806.1 RCC1 repeat- and reductase domain-containing protein [Frankia nepalensis]
IAAGDTSGYALRRDGTVRAWGGNFFGQLGNGTTTNSLQPVRVPGLTGVTAIAASGASGYALRRDGTVRAWGYNSHGQLGNGTTTDSLVPVPVTGLTNVRALAGNFLHAYALRGNGTLWAWGNNTQGQLGNGTTTNSSVPVPVSGTTGLVGVTAISAGFVSGYAVRQDGTAWAWGSNFLGQLGNGTTTDSSLPVPVLGLNNVRAISGSDYNGYAMVSD